MTSTEPRSRLPRTEPVPDDLLGNTLDTGASASRVDPVLLSPTRRSRRRGATVVATLLCAVLPVGALATGVAMKLDHDAAVHAAWQARQDRAELLAADYARDEAFLDGARLAAMAATGTELRARTLAEAQTAAEQARALAVSAEHAGADNLAALQAAAQELEDALARLGAGGGASPRSVRANQEAAAQAGQTVQAAEDAWQAEQARIAAERAAQQAAAAAAAQRRTPSTGQSSRSAGGGAVATPAATGSAWAAGVQSYGISGLGSVLNQRRAEAGLNTLSVVGSSSLANHAAAMAAAGSIWHSGRDHIVGWVEPANDSYMIQAYMDSPPHRAWILKAGVSQVAIGAVTINGVLYTAMVFS